MQNEMSPATAATGRGGALVVFEPEAVAIFREDGPGVSLLVDDGAARVVLFGFRAGQRLVEHKTSSAISVQTLRGEVTVLTRHGEVALPAGRLLRLAGSEAHSVAARTDALVLVTMTPSPRLHTLERDVFAKLTPLASGAPDKSAGRSEPTDDGERR